MTISTNYLRELSECGDSGLVRDLAAEVIRLREALEKIERHYTDTGLAAMHMAAIARAALNHKEME